MTHKQAQRDLMDAASAISAAVNLIRPHLAFMQEFDDACRRPDSEQQAANAVMWRICRVARDLVETHDMQVAVARHALEQVRK